MVEFFAGEAKKGPQTSVTVNVESPGYAYIRPGERIIDVQADSLSPSLEDRSQSDQWLSLAGGTLARST